jgi:adenylosuccinate synthase
MDVFAVIGSGYGDEGKGLMVDSLSRGINDVTVVRFNGGAQAGHTVVLPDGMRHVFHHFGSGTFAGAKTHLSKFFVVNPIFALKEYDDLKHKMKNKIEFSIDPLAPISTPWDIMINQCVESKRGQNRHGSCGLGFGETWERTESYGLLTVSDFYENPLKKILDIWDNWVPVRCKDLGIDISDLPFSLDIALQFVSDWARLLKITTLLKDEDLSCNRLIFEGAQGLGLDQDLGVFPYVTRSFTGSPNVCSLIKSLNIETVDVIYMTRCYATRHGAGPLDFEEEWSGPVINDKTNVQNNWQGRLRVAPLDVVSKKILIDSDRRRSSHCNWNAHLFVTCLDQIYVSSEAETASTSIARELDIPLFGYSRGPTYEDVIHF